MGVWSYESFGNDDASDWIAQLEECEDLSLIESALDGLLVVGNDYLEAPEASEAIAAAEVVARLQGGQQPRIESSEAVDAWVERVKLVPPPALAAKARRALDRVLTEPSELVELWDESGALAKWQASVRKLRDRIRS